MILTRRSLERGQRRWLDETIRDGGREHIDRIVGMIRDSGALERSIAVARESAEAAARALEPLPASAWKSAMLDLAAYSVARNH